MNVLRLALGELRYVWTHPARNWRAIRRFVEWQLRCLLRRDVGIPFELFDVKFYCPAERRGPTKLAFTFREQYEPELANLAEFVNPGDSVVDVGAYYGAYTLALAKLVGPMGTVLSIEPAAHALRVLRNNIHANRLINVKVVEAAAGACSGEAILTLRTDSSRNRLVPARDRSSADSGGDFEGVRLVAVDDVVDVRPVSFMKIDVEGGEAPVLSGARRLLREDRPVVQFEHNPSAASEFGHPIGAAWAVLEELNYTMFAAVAGGGLELVDAPPPDLLNVLAFPNTRLPTLCDGEI